MNKRHPLLTIGIISSILFLMLACAAPGTGSTSSKNLEQTQIALDVQATSLSLQATQKALEDANQQEEAPVQNKEVQPTYTLQPTYTPYPTQQEPTVAPPTVAPPTVEAPVQAPGLSMEERIKGANVLIYEDDYGVFDLNDRVNDAVSNVGFSGGRVINTKDAMGNFKSQLLSSTQWDLIIVAAENRDSIQGEFWDYIMDHINRDVAFIAEVWYLDDTAYGRAQAFMSKCGVQLQSDWYRDPAGYDVLDYSILWLDSMHPVLSSPNPSVSLVTPNIYWIDDVGDLIKLAPGGDAQLIGGLYYKHKSDYGVLASCLEGRAIIQTYSTHDYRYDQTVPLWENFIVYTLTNHFNKIDGN
ncbi:MAG: hypothetical protein JEZ06_06950 [Anaerolineaceae bacterium]|nr:hypothetical protein [Anaerolineaceae bacterium]